MTFTFPPVRLVLAAAVAFAGVAVGFDTPPVDAAVQMNKAPVRMNEHLVASNKGATKVRLYHRFTNLGQVPADIVRFTAVATSLKQSSIPAPSLPGSGSIASTISLRTPLKFRRTASSATCTSPTARAGRLLVSSKLSSSSSFAAGRRRRRTSLPSSRHRRTAVIYPCV
jgi:hypothetical protein